MQVNEKNQYLEYTALITKVVQWDEKAYLVANVIVKNAKGEKKIFTLSIEIKTSFKTSVFKWNNKWCNWGWS
ncbi:hypothetical protein ONA22_01005 [Mycoplasmopsis cynos]|uniref:hypothetical protein n=1 Tax=Mycoplasmopsis cynos TaxID=171284 RepID=UPI0024CAE86C|nr:hypothetical protein [Mycoplasmopsis cynos]WAM03631.1 hypothetical protein ONA22_01005 [Mycoplasmopsis cynos]